MNMTYIAKLEQTKGRDMSAYELSTLLQHKLQHNIVNINVKEVEQLERVLVQYKKEWHERYGIPTSVSAPAVVDMRAEVQMACCKLVGSDEC